MRNFSLPFRSANDNVLNDSALKGSAFGADKYFSVRYSGAKILIKRCGKKKIGQS